MQHPQTAVLFKGFYVTDHKIVHICEPVGKLYMVDNFVLTHKNGRFGMHLHLGPLYYEALQDS